MGAAPDLETLAKWRAYSEARAARYGLNVDECFPYLRDMELQAQLHADEEGYFRGLMGGWGNGRDGEQRGCEGAGGGAEGQGAGSGNEVEQAEGQAGEAAQ